MTQKKILVAVDGSEYSDKVLETAIEYARLLNAKVILIHCHKKFPTILGEPQRHEVITSIMLHAELIITPYKKKLREAEVEFEERLMEKPARNAITEVAKIQKCDLIIMGSRGLTNLGGLIIGSVTNRVLHTAPCSVLVVK